jgi:hypothetical protein
MIDKTPTDDQELISRLGQILDEADSVPGDVAEFARAAFTWRDIDAELAAIEYDSATEDTFTGVRSTATARIVTFEAGPWSIDIEYHEPTKRLIGQVNPGQKCTIEMHNSRGTVVVSSDGLGRFDFDEVFPGPASLVIQTPDQVIKTEWTVL